MNGCGQCRRLSMFDAALGAVERSVLETERVPLSVTLLTGPTHALKTALNGLTAVPSGSVSK